MQLDGLLQHVDPPGQRELVAERQRKVVQHEAVVLGACRNLVTGGAQHVDRTLQVVLVSETFSSKAQAVAEIVQEDPRIVRRGVGKQGGLVAAERLAQVVLVPAGLVAVQQVVAPFVHSSAASSLRSKAGPGASIHR